MALLNTEQVNRVMEYFADNYSHVEINQVDTETISELLSRGYIAELSFELQMDCLYDYILSQGLADITE